MLRNLLPYKKFNNKSQEIPRNRFFVYLIGPYNICRKGKKEDAILKVITIINIITGWYEITQYDDKRAITTVNLDETTMAKHLPFANRNHV